MSTMNEGEKSMADAETNATSNASKTAILASTEDKVRPGVLLNDNQELAEVMGALVNTCILANDSIEVPLPNHHDVSVVEVVEDSRHALEYHYKQSDEEAVTVFKLSHVVAPLQLMKTATPYPPACKSYEDKECICVEFVAHSDV